MVASKWAHSLRTGEPYDIDYRFRHHSGEYRWLRVMALPVRHEDGTITRWFGTSTDVHDSYILADERESLARELQRIATHDELTSVLTRRAFFEQSVDWLTHGRSEADICGLLMLDIDHFKSINDRYGHPVGDRVLNSVAKRMINAVRRADLVGRLGGEEFAIFLPRCPRDQVLIVAERIRTSIEALPIGLDNGLEIHVTISIGAVFAQTPGGLNDMLLEADRALYEAKENGRNRTTLSDYNVVAPGA